MMYVIYISLGVNVVLALLFWMLVKELNKATTEIKRQDAIRKNLIYQIDLMRDAEKLKNESRKKAEQKMGSIDFNNVDTALSVLHDNTDGD